MSYVASYYIAAIVQRAINEPSAAKEHVRVEGSSNVITRRKHQQRFAININAGDYGDYLFGLYLLLVWSMQPVFIDQTLPNL